MSEQHWLRKFAANQRAHRTQILPSPEDFESVADEIESLQARIDALMLEYCPNEMTPAQIERWERHQRPTSG